MVKAVFNAAREFFSAKLNRRLFYIVIIAAAALADFLTSGYSRRTFVFYSPPDGKPVVEERMLRRSSSIESDIRQYIEETLLGPVSPGLPPLFPRKTKLLSLLLRENVVYAGFSEDAALPENGEDVFKSFLTLNSNIRRNFRAVKNIKFFIGGNEIFSSEFSGIFADPADNIIKTSQQALTD